MSAFLRLGAMQLYQLLTGRRVLARLGELDRTQWLGRDELSMLQRDKLQHVVEYAYQYVPYYRRTFEEVGFHPDDLRGDLAALLKIPMLTKGIIRENFDEMLTTESKRRARMSRLTTGGSTGQPLVFMQDNNYRDYVTADIHRHLGWAGWRFGQLHAYIWGAHFEVSTAQSFRSRLMDWVLNRFLTNAYVLSEETMRAFAERIVRQRPRILFGYASSLHRFAQFVRQEELDGITFEGIFASAEVLYPDQRQYIEETFQCKVFNRYGTRELGGVACECAAHAGLHVSVENNCVEILDDGDPAPAGRVGDIVVTNLNNYGMPFIRYAIEDVGAWRVDDVCSCGRQSPMIDRLQGRRIDMFKTRDGCAVWGGFINLSFGIEGVRRFQIVQESLDLIVVRIVKEGELDPTRLTTIERRVKAALGDDVEIRFEFPDEIPVIDSGKYRFIISRVDDEPYWRDRKAM